MDKIMHPAIARVDPRNKRNKENKEIVKNSRLHKKTFYQRFPDSKLRWYKCIISQREYFEGDEINVKEWIHTFRQK